MTTGRSLIQKICHLIFERERRGVDPVKILVRDFFTNAASASI